VRRLSSMSRYSDLENRLDVLRKRARRGADAALLREMEDVLASGYAQAIEADLRSRRLHRRAGELAQALPEEGAALELRRVTLEQRSLDEATRDLRARLGDMRRLFVELGGVSVQLGSASSASP
jgi:hypothetical protein